MLGKVDPLAVPPGAHLKSPLAAVHAVDAHALGRAEPDRGPDQRGAERRVPVQRPLPRDGGRRRRPVQLRAELEATLLSPQIRSTIRDVVARVSAKELYDSSGRTEIATELLHRLNEPLAARPPSSILPLRTSSPQRLVQAIEDKMRQEQEHERMQFVLMKERAEAERKEIEARVIARVPEGGRERHLEGPFGSGIQSRPRSHRGGHEQQIVVIGTGGSDGVSR